MKGLFFDRKKAQRQVRLQEIEAYIQQHRQAAEKPVRWNVPSPTACRQSLPQHRAEAVKPCSVQTRSAPASCVQPQSLTEFLRKKDAGFVETLLERIQKSGKKNSAIYKKANISKQHFSKLINNPDATITKPVAVAFALALELDLTDTRDLIGRAGYTLTNSSVFDLIIQYHIENKLYNVVEINLALYEFDQPLLGCNG